MLSHFKNSAIAWELRRARRPAAYWLAERSFLERVIPQGLGCIIDVGASSGGKTEIFLTLAPNVVAIEPDPLAAETLRRRFRWRSVEIIEAAVSNAHGTATFYQFEPASAFNTLDVNWARCMTDGSNHMQKRLNAPHAITVRTVTLSEIEQRYRPVKYIKIDAEGYEAEILSTLTFITPLVSMEFNLPQMWPALHKCLGHLMRISASYRFNLAITEPPLRFALAEWGNADAITDAIVQNDWRYAEVYAAFSSSSLQSSNC